MPNWCSNSLSIAGEENELKRFMEVGRSPDKHLDTLAFVPYPPEQTEIDDQWYEIREEQIKDYEIFTDENGYVSKTPHIICGKCLRCKTCGDCKCKDKHKR